MTTALAAGRATADEVFEVQDKLFHWALAKSQNNSTAQKVVNCLQEDFLLRLQAPEEKHYWPSGTPGTRN